MVDGQDLYLRYRPKKFAHVFGQETAVAQLSKFIEKGKVPRAMSFVGPSGTGKSTCARIMQKQLECSDLDFYDINFAIVKDQTDVIRDIESKLGQAPRGGKCKVFLLEEAQQLAKSSSAANALLGILERDVTKEIAKCYFILCTTDESKIIPAIKTRVTKVVFKDLTDEAVRKTVQRALDGEKKKLDKVVFDKLVENSGACGRTALVLLHKIIDLDSPKEQLANLGSPEGLKAQAFELVKVLLYQKRGWKEVVEVIKKIDCQKDEKEGLRQFVLACAKTELMKANTNQKRAYLILVAFGDPWWGKEVCGLETSCFEVCMES